MKIEKAFRLWAVLLLIGALSGCGQNHNLPVSEGTKDMGIGDIGTGDAGAQEIETEEIKIGDAGTQEIGAEETKTEDAGTEDTETEDIGLEEIETEINGRSASMGETEGSAGGEGQIDVDLTQMSGTMIFAEVYQMMVTPEAYIGRTIRMDGEFAIYEASPQKEGDPDYYYAVIIADATGCCQQGMEFVWNGDHPYPASYPEPGEQVTVTGVFETYEENGDLYCRLRSDNPFLEA